jgi:dephospho-CoA kinase
VELPLQIGITGGIGSGKSLVCKIFNRLGIPVYDADSHAKELMTTDGILISQIKKEFGELSYLGHGGLNRTYLIKEVFSDAGKLSKLNGLVHPRVAHHYEMWVQRQAGMEYVVKEAALLVEAGSYKTLDRLIVVSAPEALRIQRVLKRDPHRTEQQVREVMANQMPEQKKLDLADNVIVNDETRLVIPQVLELHRLFRSMKPPQPEKREPPETLN